MDNLSRSEKIRKMQEDKIKKEELHEKREKIKILVMKEILSILKTIEKIQAPQLATMKTVSMDVDNEPKKESLSTLFHDFFSENDIIDIDTDID